MRYFNMRTADLFTPVALLSLYMLSTNAEPTCHTNHFLSSAELSATHVSSLQAALEGSVAEFCGEILNAKGKDSIAHTIERVTFQITGAAIQSIEECTASFAAIVAQCFINEQLGGGEVQTEAGAIYEVYHNNAEQHDEDLNETYIEERGVQTDQDDLDDLLHLMGSQGLEARAGKGNPAAPAKPPAKKPDSKPLPIEKPKPAPTPKPTPTPKSPQSSSSSASKAVPTKNCKQIYDIAFKDVVSEALELQAEETQLDNAGAIARRGYVGSMTNLGSMKNLDRRTKKPGAACGVEKFDALDYPEPANMPATAKFYHFTDPTACDALAFAGAAKEARGLKRTDYQIEHVLEWQVVTKFFEWVQTKKADEKFDNPDPKKTNKLKFCSYWKATWEGANSPMFKLKPDDKKELNALDHLRHAYPGKNNFPEEFVWLHTAVNSPAKAQMWSTKNTDKIYGDKTTRKVGGKGKPDKISTGMTDLIVGTNKASNIPQARPTVDSARQAYFKLKWILGARMYLKNAEIKVIFKKQKERIGDVLDALDTAMETQPKKTRTGDVMNAWKKQDLKALWDEYMDEKFAAAKKRSENDMDKYLRLLEGKWSQKKDLDAAENDRIVFLLQIRKLKAAWDTEKKSWIAPWK